MLDGLKEIERLRAALSRLLFAVESGRYGPAALRALVRQEAGAALGLMDDAEVAAIALPEAPAQRLLEAPREALPAARQLTALPAPARRRLERR